MSAQVKFTGMKELIEFLTNAPAELKQEGQAICREETEGMAAEVRSHYNSVRVTGNLANGVRTNYAGGDLIIGQVYSASPHSHLYEFKTVRDTKSGTKTYPGANVFVPIAERRRATFHRRLVEMVRKKGFVVEGV